MSGIDHFSTAREMAAALRAREISARELLELHLTRIEEVNPQVNALVSLDPDRARAQALARAVQVRQRAAGPAIAEASAAAVATAATRAADSSGVP